MTLRAAKLGITRLAGQVGLSKYVLESSWRRARLLILCYHGVSLDDEHEWLPGMYVSPQLFRQRLETLQAYRCAVLPLGDAVRRLRDGTLPPRSVAITFDDGFYDFLAVAWPLLKRFGLPATVYLTTYYSEHNWPVFDLMLEYLLWKARDRKLDWPEALGQPIELGGSGRGGAAAHLREYAARNSFSGAEKDALLSELARRLGISMEELASRRVLHLMNPAEVRQVSAEGADIQLHTHRHRVFKRRERFWQEIDDNRRYIEADTGQVATHFCYPGGFTQPEFPGWLRERGVESGTTCFTGIASRKDDALLLPRLLDTNLTSEEFESWISGWAALFPRRAVAPSATQLGVETPGAAC